MAKATIFNSIDAFRQAARADKTALAPDCQVRASFDTEIKAAGDDSRVLTFTISTASVDRMGDTIKVEGWKLDNYRKNPVVLWAHASDTMPLAKANKIWVEGGKLMAEVEFMPREISGFADAVFRALQGGYLSATSVGFAPIKYAFSEEDGRSFGIDFLEQELLELSIVPVPANAEALIEGRSAAGLDIAPFRAWAEKMLAADGQAVIPRERLEAMLGLPKKFRSIAKTLPDTAKGARGQLLRCANMAEKEIGVDVIAAMAEADEPETEGGATATSAVTEPADQTADTAVVAEPETKTEATPRLALARRRLALVRQTT